MTEAGWPLKKGAEYYDKAAAKYKEIIENEATYGYILEPDIRTLTKEPEANYSKEIVFGEFHNKTKNYFSGPKSELPVDGVIIWLNWNFSEVCRKEYAKMLGS